MLSLRPGGLENGVVNVVNGLDPREFRSSVCCLQELGEFSSRIADPEVGRYAMGLRPGNDWRLPMRLARLFRRIGADIVHTRNAESGFYGIIGAKLAGVRGIVHSEHGRTFPEKPHRAWLQRMLMSRIDAAFAVSECLRRDLIREIGVSGTDVQVVYNGVDLRRFENAADRRREPGRGGLVIGSVGRLVEVKNYPLLLRAFATLPQSPPVRLLLVGEGPMHEHLSRMAQMLGIADRVEFAGHRDDIAVQLRRMDIFVLPSTSEGLSNTLMEAMASGLAVVASDVGGNPELVAAGENGLLFASGDESALAKCLQRMTLDDSFRGALGAAAALSIGSRFSLPGMINRYESLYRRVANGDSA
jgi:sugar transferase (PEP-CTERM/EpsH1 system associated)